MPDSAIEQRKGGLLKGENIMAALGTLETTNILLLLIVGLIVFSLIRLEKIKSATETNRDLQWRQHFGQPYHEATRNERRVSG